MPFTGIVVHDFCIRAESTYTKDGVNLELQQESSKQEVPKRESQSDFLYSKVIFNSVGYSSYFGGSHGNDVRVGLVKMQKADITMELQVPNLLKEKIEQSSTTN